MFKIEHSLLVLASRRLYTEPLTWNDANQYCKSIGQHLVEIDRQTKQQLLHEALLDIEQITPNFEGDIWIGLHAPDPNQPTNRVWTNNCVSSNSFSNWSPGMDTGNDKLCAYVEVENEDMHWLLAECGTDARSFISICNEGFSYDIANNTRLSTGMDENYQINPGTALECTDTCSGMSICWAFLFTTTVPTKCVLYGAYNGPFQTEHDKIPASGKDVYTKRCNFELISDCVLCETTQQVTTTQFQTSTQIETTSFKVSTADKTPEITLPTTTENYLTTTVEVTSSDNPTTTSQLKITSTDKKSIQKTTEHYSTSNLEVTTSQVQTTPSQSETTEVGNTSSFTTTQPETTEVGNTSSFTTTQPETTEVGKTSSFTTTQQRFTTNNTGKTPYCVCTCNNVTKQVSLQESINEIVNEIKVDKSRTSSYTRKHTSAWDSRKSSASIGFVGIAILISVASLIVCLDSTSLIYRVCALLRKTGTS
ncbi:Hypothetical predicted protein [Mytilus galloprovincialis]|uniref:C-type lectin domain-containing protein n=1 Tax=Mytilus galloprovincialis TaxID=29158 RepID=A0A8B6FGK2_MYTGA|nr:Hypothetical predicted protein [Mytilus galloprovincialis]